MYAYAKGTPESFDSTWYAVLRAERIAAAIGTTSIVEVRDLIRAATTARIDKIRAS